MIAHRTQFLCLYQENKPYASKRTFDMLVSNHGKMVLKAAKLFYDYKTKESVTSQKSGACKFWQIKSYQQR